MPRVKRREFLLGSGGALAAGSAALMLRPFAQAHVLQSTLDPGMVRLRPEIEPVVRWIETTPRERILDVAADAMRKGLPYRELLAGVFLAGIRNVKPRPVGFKFHTVLVMNSADQLAAASPPAERLYPVLWALDHFKDAQAADVKAGDWVLGPVDESALPTPGAAAEAFTRAMENWDAPAADCAAARLARSGTAADVREAFWPYAARNFRNIGHNIIFAAQAFRTLDTIGWQHAEPVLRSLAYGLLDGAAGEATTAPFEESRRLAASFGAARPEAKPDAAATTALLETLRSAKPEEASREAAALLRRGAAAPSLWDAILLGAGELLLRRPGLVSLHAVTAMNSMHHGYRAARTDAIRRILLLQGAAWVTLFRGEFGVRGQQPLPEALRLDRLEPAATESVPQVEAVFQEMGRDRTSAARLALAFARGGGSAQAYVNFARGLVYRKGNDVHDFKFAAALFEELGRASEACRPYLLAAGACHLEPSTAADAPLHGRISEVLRRL